MSSVIAPTDNEGSVNLNRSMETVAHPPIYNVKAYGATGDGSVDDTQFIQAALDAATKGGVVYFPAGTYRVTQTLVISQHFTILRGAGYWASVVINHEPNATVIRGISNNNQIQMANLPPGWNPNTYFNRWVGFEEIQFTGTGDDAVCIDTSSFQKFSMRRITVSTGGLRGRGIYCAHADAGVGPYYSEITNLWYSAGSSNQEDSWAIYMDRKGTTNTGRTANHWTITHGRVSATQNGFSLQGEGHSVRSVRFETLEGVALQFGDTNFPSSAIGMVASANSFENGILAPAGTYCRFADTSASNFVRCAFITGEATQLDDQSGGQNTFHGIGPNQESFMAGAIQVLAASDDSIFNQLIVGDDAATRAANLHVKASSPATRPLVVEAAVGQTANLVEVREEESGGAVLCNVDSGGYVEVSPHERTSSAFTDSLSYAMRLWNRSNTDDNITGIGFYDYTGVGLTCAVVGVTVDHANYMGEIAIVTRGDGDGFAERLRFGSGANAGAMRFRNVLADPTMSQVDASLMYSQNVTPGNACPHFRTENGDEVKLYRQGALTPVDPTAPTGPDAAVINNNRTRIEDIENRLKNLGLIP